MSENREETANDACPPTRSGETNAPDQNTYDAYCGQVNREDKLVNNRLSWLLTTEGLLFGALALMASSSGNTEVDAAVVKALKQCIPIIGIVIPISALITNLFSHVVVAGLLEKWNTIQCHFPNHPSPFGGQESAVPSAGPSVVLPLSIVAAWVWIIWSIWPC